MSESAPQFESSADSSLILIPSQELDYRDYHTTLSYERFSQQSDDQVDCINETPPAEVSALMSKEDVSAFLKYNGIPEQYCKVFEGSDIYTVATLL